jgi:hypothetical protein
MNNNENFYSDISMDMFANMSQQEQLHCIEQALIELWENDIVDLVGFDEYKQPLFKLKDISHG